MMKLYQYRTGDRLPPLLRPDGTWVFPHVVSITPNRHGYTLTHDYGDSIPFESYGIDVAFPVRHDNDGRRVYQNWCLTMEHPTPEQLAVGDILPPHGSAMDPRNDTDWAEMEEDERLEVLKEFWDMAREADDFQVVTSVAPGEHWGLVSIHTQQYVYDLNIGQTFKQPWQPRVALPKRKAPPLDRYPRSGTYRHRVTQKEAQFAIHHAGKGRYPLFVPVYNVAGSGFMMPPQRKDFPKSRGNTTPYADEWNWWELMGGGKAHPFDPRGKTGADKSRAPDAPLDFYDDPNAG